MTDYRLTPSMNLWTDDNASMMEAFMSSDLSSFWPPPLPLPPPPPPPQPSSSAASSAAAAAAAPLPAAPFNQDTLQHRLQTLIESTSRYPWTYAIFWQSSFDSYPAAAAASSSTPPIPVLGWGDGYYKGEEDKSKGKAKISASSAAEQEHRKRVLRELNSLIAGPSATAPDDAVDEEVTDTEWFFLVSMTQSFGNDGSLPGQALFNSSPIWVSGGDRLADCGCERAKQGRIFGLQTIACMPVIGGVVELGSTELIFQSSDLMNKVRNLFNFNGAMELGFGGNGNDQGESDPSSLWINDPPGTVEVKVKVKDSAAPGAAAVAGSPNYNGSNHGSKSIHFENNHVLTAFYPSSMREGILQEYFKVLMERNPEVYFYWWKKDRRGPYDLILDCFNVIKGWVMSCVEDHHHEEEDPPVLL